MTAAKSNAALAREYVDAAMASPDQQSHVLVRRHGAEAVLRAANTLAVLATADAIREGGPTSLRDCIEALAPTLRPQPRYKVGDPDPTPDICPDEGYCDRQHHDGRHTYYCTWPAGHEGDHVTGGSDGEILAVWS